MCALHFGAFFWQFLKGFCSVVFFFGSVLIIIIDVVQATQTHTVRECAIVNATELCLAKLTFCSTFPQHVQWYLNRQDRNKHADRRTSLAEPKQHY